MNILQISYHTAPFGNVGQFDSGGLNVYVQQISKHLSQDHNVTVGEFHDILKSTFDDDDANILFTLLSRASLEAVDDEDNGEDKEQDAKDREDERLADEDKEASDREDDGDKYAQSLADRRRESSAAKKKLKGEGLTKDLNEAIIQKALRRALRGE